MNFLFSSHPSRKKCPHVQWTMPTFQYDRHILHCALGSTSSSSHNSMFPAALIMSCDSLLKGLNCRRCWRSLWCACRWGWFSIFWIKFWTLTPCDRFTAECGNPGTLKSMFSSLIALLNSLSVLNDAMSRFSSGTNCSFTVCALELFRSSGFPDLSWVCLTRVFSDKSSGFPDLSEETSSSCKHFSSISWERDVSPLTTNTSSVLSGFPDRSQIGLGFGWVGLENSSCWTSPQDCWTSLPTGCCSTVEPNLSFPLFQPWSCRNDIFGGGRGDMYDFSYKTSPVFNLTTFGIQ